MNKIERLRQSIEKLERDTLVKKISQTVIKPIEAIGKATESGFNGIAKLLQSEHKETRVDVGVANENIKQLSKRVDEVVSEVSKTDKNIRKEVEDRQVDLSPVLDGVEDTREDVKQVVEDSRQVIEKKIEDSIVDTAPVMKRIEKLEKVIEKKDFRGKPGLDGKAGKSIKGGDGEKGERGEKGNDGSPDTPEQVRDKISLLKGSNRLDAKHIKNIKKYVKSTTTAILDKVGDITAVIAGDGLTGGGDSGDVTLSLDTDYVDSRYLKLDASNDPVTGQLDIQVDTEIQSALVLQTTDDDTTENLFNAFKADGTTSLMALTADGKLGIGTDSPTMPVDVNTNIDGISRIIITNTSTDPSAQAGFQAISATSRMSFAAFPDTYSVASFADRVAMFADSNAGGINLAALAAAGDIKFMTGGTNERVSIGSSGGVTITGGEDVSQLVVKANSTQTTNIFEVQDVDGNADVFIIDGDENVGIGTDAPATPFHVERNQNTATRIAVRNLDTGAAAQSGIQCESATSKLSFAAYPDTYSVASFADRVALFGDSNAGGINIASLANPSDIRFFTDGVSERMRLQSEGLLTIGPSGGGTARFNVIGSTDIVQQIIQANATQTNDLAHFRTSAGAVRMRVSQDGHIAIGNTSLSTRMIRLDKSFDTATTVYAINGEIANAGSGNIYGLNYQARSTGSGTPFGLVSQSRGTSTSTAAKLEAGLMYTRWDGTATLPTAYSLRIEGDIGTGTISSQYGLYMGNVNRGTYSYAIYTNAGDVSIGDTLKTRAGIVKNTTRVTTTYTILVSDSVVFANTDSAGYTVTLPEGVEGQTLRIINCGSSGNILTIDGDGTEELRGATTQDVADGEIMILTYNATEGWW